MNALSKSMVLAVLIALTLGVLATTLPFMVNAPSQPSTITVTVEKPVTTVSEPVKPTTPVTVTTGVALSADYAKVVEALNNSLRLLMRAGSLAISAPGALPAPEIATTPLVAAVTPRGESSYAQIGYSSTNVQVIGVDEQDVVKTDGRYIYILRDSEIVIFDPVNMRVISKFKLPEESGYTYIGQGLYVLDGKLVVLASKSYPYTILPIRAYPFQVLGETAVIVVDVSNPENPVLVNKVIVDGDLRGSRLVDNYLYVVTTMPCFKIEGDKYVPLIPRINGEYIPASNIVIPEEPAQYYVVLLSLDISSGVINSTAVLQNTVDWIYMTPSRLYLASRLGNYMSMIIYDKYKEIFVNTTIALNLLPREIYLNISGLVEKGDYEGAFSVIESYIQTLSRDKAVEFVETVDRAMPSYSSYTVFTVIEVNGTLNSFKGFVKVEGNVLDQFAMEELESGKYFITATTTTLFKPVFKVLFEDRAVIMPEPVQTAKEGKVEVVTCDKGVCVTRSIAINISTPVVKESYSVTLKTMITMYVETATTENHVYVIDTENLAITGYLKGIAEGERIYAARLIKNIFYLVTFRNIDPLFAIDISNSSNPRIIGYLKIPGFSEYLHPVSDELLLGIGVEDQYLKISLFDVEDPLNIREVSSIKTQGWSIILGDHHAFTYDQRHGTVYIPVTVVDPSTGGVVSGVLVFKIDIAEKKLDFLNILSHENAIRTVYIGNTVYTISTALIKAWSMPSHEYIGEAYLD